MYFLTFQRISLLTGLKRFYRTLTIHETLTVYTVSIDDLYELKKSIEKLSWARYSSFDFVHWTKCSFNMQNVI